MRIAIIGGSGKMGRWFGSLLSKEGKEVIIIGRSEKKLLEVKRQLGVEVSTDVEAIKSADVILVSVPIANFEEVVERIHPHIQPKQVVMDVTSIKEFPVEVMHKHIKTGLTLGTHPVFGPGARGIANHNFVLTPTSEDERTLAEKVREYLEDRGARVTLMTPHEHDEMMAVVLGLAHFISIVSADTLASFDKLAMMRAVGGSTYKVLLTLVESVISEDPELYAALQMSLPDLVGIEELFQRNSGKWAALVRNKDGQGFINKIHALKNKLEKDDPDFGKAYDNMYKVVEGL
ncbi:prephenate dehydrogenase [Chloroflexota bacterium]